MSVDLRAYRESDRDAFVELFTDRRVMDRAGGAFKTEAADRLFHELLEGSYARLQQAWAVEKDGRYIGHAILFQTAEEALFELGVLLRVEHWGRGLGREIFARLVQAAKEHNGSAMATVDLDHLACRRALERAGLYLEEVERDEDGDVAIYRTRSSRSRAQTS